LQQVHLAPQVSDYRGLTKDVLPFTFRLLYSLTAPDVPTDVFPSKIWNNTIPPKCKHLLLLVHHNRLPCRASLHDHNIAGSSACAMCGHREDEAHLSLHYVHAKGDLRKAWTATCFIMFRDYVYLEPPLSSPYCRKSCRPLSSLRCCRISGKKEEKRTSLQRGIPRGSNDSSHCLCQSGPMAWRRGAMILSIPRLCLNGFGLMCFGFSVYS
jgi:hypothetical protein